MIDIAECFPGRGDEEQKIEIFDYGDAEVMNMANANGGHPCPDPEFCGMLIASLSHALRYFHNAVKLAENPLVRERLIVGHTVRQRVENLRGLVESLAQALHPSPHYDVVNAYLEGKRKDASQKTMYRHRVEAVRFLAHVYMEENGNEKLGNPDG